MTEYRKSKWRRPHSKSPSTPECYPDDKEDTSTELTAIMNTKTVMQELATRIDDVPTSTDTGYAK
jgi:hypothetical protein